MSSKSRSETRPVQKPRWLSREFKKNVVWWTCLTLMLALYALTLMQDISGCQHEYCVDVGEFQIALAEWGTAHYTGYPLYMLLGSPFVTLLRFVGISPATGASLYSLIWGMLALVGVGTLIQRLTGHQGLSGSIILALGSTTPIWIHNVIAEVYSMSLLFAVLILWLTLDLSETWSDRKGWVLALIGGLSVAHHRLMALMLPMVGLYLLPHAWHSKHFWRWLGGAVIFFVLGFVPYLDIPLRVWRGATWTYGTPGDWENFWFLFWGHEVSFLQQPDFGLGAIQKSLHNIFVLFRAEIGSSGMGLTALGSLLALSNRESRKITLLLWSISLGLLGFAVVLHQAVLLEAVIIIPLLCFGIIIALGAGQLPLRWQAAAAVLLYLWGGYLGWRHYPNVIALTKDTTGRAYIAQVEQLEAPPRSVIMALWGQKYFALSYAQRLEHRMTQWQIVDHRADLAHLAQNTGGKIYTSADMLYLMPVEAWRNILGTPLRITSAGPNMIALTSQPLPAPVTRHPIGDGIALTDWKIHPRDSAGNVRITLYWAAEFPPSADYSTYVHVTDKDYILTPSDLLAQSDFAAPVFGWYPTSQWQTNEVIREDHLLALPDEAVMRTIIIGMYRRETNGSLHNLNPVRLTWKNGNWQLQEL